MGLQSLGGGRSDVLELHVQDALGDILQDGVRRQHLLSDGLGGCLVLSLNVVAFEDLGEVYSFVVYHLFSSFSRPRLPETCSDEMERDLI
ncbi:MAG: hypothetical protein A3205_04770 [Methanomassiliicoccales archaeon Mx-03]|nr:MAG: hypothetical protein A3205_04770 [Methanomassiliicoccales archaeon Mx-03]